MRKSDILLISSAILLVTYFLTSVAFPSLVSPIITAYNWLLDASLLLGYWGNFIVSFLGNATILIPFPYLLVPFILGGLYDEMIGQFLFDPFILGIISGFGAVLGEMTGYLIGFYGGQLIDKQQKTAFSDYIRIHPKATPFLLWFLAATPIPDDILIVPLGAAKYPWWKVFIPQFFGKSMFMTVIAWSGRIGLSIVESYIGSADPFSISSRIIEVVSVFLIILIIYAITRIDWTRLATSRIHLREETFNEKS